MAQHRNPRYCILTLALLLASASLAQMQELPPMVSVVPFFPGPDVFSIQEDELGRVTYRAKFGPGSPGSAPLSLSRYRPTWGFQVYTLEGAPVPRRETELLGSTVSSESLFTTVLQPDFALQTVAYTMGNLDEFDIRQEGLYYLAYERPDALKEHDGDSVRYGEGRTYFAVVSPKRMAELRDRYPWDLPVGFAMDRFQAAEMTSLMLYPRSAPLKYMMEEGILHEGLPPDEVMYLLGAPEPWSMQALRAGAHGGPDPGEGTWSYTLGPTSGLWLEFHDGTLATIRVTSDSGIMEVREGDSLGWARFWLGEPERRTICKELQNGEYDELWEYGEDMRLYFRSGKLVRKESPYMP